MEIINSTAQTMEYPINSAEWHFQQILMQLGEDVTREGMIETPKRYLKFMREFLEKKEFNLTTFDAEGSKEMILIDNIPFYSLCEHHTAPFFGFANIAYIPNKKIVGISKIPRTLDYFANRFQNQERITMQVADFLEKNLNPKGVAVFIKATHLCMCMRGVKKQNSFTNTFCFKGDFDKIQVQKDAFLKYCN